MKKANVLLDELNNAIDSAPDECYRIENHLAKELDDYMKEQYFMLLFWVLAQSEENTENAVSYLLFISKKAGFSDSSENIVKYVYSINEKKMQDIFVSFRDEEIKYLFGLELCILSEFITKSEKVHDCIKNVYIQLEISEKEQICLSQIKEVIKNNDLSLYTQKEYYSHRNTLSCYLDKIDFESSRIFLKARFPKSKDNTYGGFFEFLSSLAPEVAFEWKRFSNGSYVEKGDIVSSFEVTSSASHFGPESCTEIKAEKSGIFYYFTIINSNGEVHIKKWCRNGNSFALIFHPLDNMDNMWEILKNKLLAEQQS